MSFNSRHTLPHAFTSLRQNHYPFGFWIETPNREISPFTVWLLDLNPTLLSLASTGSKQGLALFAP
ncbi:hypothetical protein [Proteus vulgaris]|uniref:hypothetical protein n=1 Tax=Proteus vulgaris TaxID=585 RepID=UPI00156FEBC7|nr:hypothetical protein [Proteus vulgaris]UBH61907.1 hypothetical protein LA322_17815 [Proteus vulgaris]